MAKIEVELPLTYEDGDRTGKFARRPGDYEVRFDCAGGFPLALQRPRGHDADRDAVNAFVRAYLELARGALKRELLRRGSRLASLIDDATIRTSYRD